jgi:CTP synthase (UTP-ammonia lyase)
MSTLTIALIGDYDPSITAHRAIPLALELAAAAEEVEVEWQWVATRELDASFASPALSVSPASPASSVSPALLDRMAGIWCVPGSPYASAAGALSAIRHARLSQIPFLGTCGGFQHLILEYAEGVWGLSRAAHAETDPEAIDPVIAPLACALVEQSGRVFFSAGSRTALAYGTDQAVEGYHCSYGIGPRYGGKLATGALRVTGRDQDGEIRVVELEDHPFYVGTLFQPERAALTGQVPPLVRAFLRAAAVGSGSTPPLTSHSLSS